MHGFQAGQPIFKVTGFVVVCVDDLKQTQSSVWSAESSGRKRPTGRAVNIFFFCELVFICLASAISKKGTACGSERNNGSY